MKRLFTFLTVSLLLAAASVAVIPAVSSYAASPRAVEGTTPQEQASFCYDKWNGRTISGAELTEFRSSTCAARNNGVCTGGQPTNNNVSVTCTAPASAGGTSSEANAGGGSVDPAYLAAGVCNKNGCNIIRNYLNPIIVLLTTLVGLAVVIGIIVGGIQVASSAGDPQKSASGKKHIQNAIIGLIAYAVLFAFIEFVIPGGISQ